MLVNASQVADTLRLLVPGFVLLKTFYLFGLRTKRSDAQWVIWSILAAVPLNGLAIGLVGISGTILHRGQDANIVLAVAVVLAALGGWILGKIWQWLVGVRPKWGADAAIRAWDNVFGRTYPEWIQVMLTDQATVYSGKPRFAARSLQTDDLDLYLLQPALLVNGRSVELPGVEGILVPRSQISAVAVFSPEPTPDEPAGDGQAGTALVSVVTGLCALLGAALIAFAVSGTLGWLPAAKPILKDASAGNAGTFIVAGATLVLAAFTFRLASLTNESLAATRREAGIAEKSLAAIQEQAKIAERQVTATNEQTDVARAQLTASWRPILVERGMESPSIDIHPSLEEAFGFEAEWMNIGRGPAFIRRAFLTLGAGGNAAVAIRPRLAEPGAIIRVVFRLSPHEDGLDRVIAQQLAQGSDLWAYVLYHDVGRASAWRSQARLTKLEKFPTMFDWALTEAEVSDVPLSALD